MVKHFWGLFVDDGRLAGILVATVLVAGVLSHIHAVKWAVAVLWVGVALALWTSVNHQIVVHRQQTAKNHLGP